MILHELDSSFFNSEFKFKKSFTSNERLATLTYIEKYPETKVRPFGFEGRNQYRRSQGMRPTDHLTLQLIDSLNRQNLLTKEESKIFNDYTTSLDPLKEIAAKSPDHFNNSETDKLCEIRQIHQYLNIPKITNNRAEFANRFLTKPNGEKISYRDGYQLWAHFWDTRNQAMSKNILNMAKLNKGEKIVVLTGFMHRYYLLRELKRLTKGENIVIKEYYEF